MSNLKPMLLTALKSYDKSQFVKDVTAGIIVAIIALPLSIALALASGVGPEAGIFTAIVAGFVISALGGSCVQIAGPTAAFATIVAGIVARDGMDGLVIATVLAGVFLILMGICRFGSLIKFIPYTITTGFTSGIAVTIVIGQLKDFFGVTYPEGVRPIETMEKLAAFLENVGTVNPAALIVGAVSLAILIISPYIFKKIPGSLIAVIVGIVVIVFVRDFPEEKGGYPDNNPAFDGEKAKAEHQAALEYLKTSKWTALKCLKTGRMWVLWIAVGITGFMSMGIMSNFVTKFMVMGYELPTVLQMLGIAGVLAIPGSIVVGWLDVKIGTKKTGILINVLAFVAVLCCLTHVTVLHYISLPILAVMLGGSSNLMVSCTAAIWGRYDFKNAFSVIQPLNSVMTGVGITVVSACNSIDPTCQLAYIIMAVMAVIGLND